MRRPNRKIFLPLLVLFLLSFSLFPQANGPQTANTCTGKVVGIANGDTISVMRGGQAVKVRLQGIDYPEKRQAFGKRAKRHTSDMAFGKEITVRIKTTDRYGRIAELKRVSWLLS